MSAPFESLGGHKLYAVNWVDTQRDTSSHFTADRLKGLLPVEMWTVGWGFILEDRIVLGCEHHPDGPDQVEGYRIAFTIPKMCVKQVIELAAKIEKLPPLSSTLKEGSDA